MRSLIRVAAERLVTGSGVAALARRRLGPRTAILAYHNVVPEDEAGRGDASLHLPLPAFIDQVERMRETHDVVALERAGSAEPEPGRRPRAVVTFDDAYRGAVTLALPELARRGVPATMFVSPGLLGRPSTWWDELAEAGRLSPEVRRAALEECEGRADRVRERFGAGIGRGGGLPRTYGIATPEELRSHALPGIRLGSHAWEHEHLPSLTADRREESLARTWEWLAGFEVGWVPWLALPYGAGSRELGRAAAEAGHAGVLRIEGGLWDPSRMDSSWAPRVNVPAALSVRGLELRAAGLLRR